MYKKFQPTWLICLIILTVMIAGCRSKPDIVNPTATSDVTIPFDTIENADGSGLRGYYTGDEPKLVIIITLAEAEALGESISNDAAAQLQKVDFSQNFVIAVFRGDQASMGENVEIQRIVQKNNEVEIFAHFPVIGPEPVIVLPTVYSPYHIVEIPKKGIHGEINFFLNVDGKIIIHQPKFIS